MTDVLYASQGGTVTNSPLWILDPATGLATSVASMGVAFTGMAQDPTTGIVYGITSNQSLGTPQALYTVDPTTAAVTLIGALALGYTLGDITFDTSGNLFGQSGNSPYPAIHSIDKTTGVATSLGSYFISGAAASGLGCTIIGGVYYAFWQGFLTTGGSPSHYYSFDTSTGVPTDEGALSGFAPVGGAGTCPACATLAGDSTIWAIGTLSTINRLLSVDPLTGVIANRVTLSDFTTQNQGIDALAWVSSGAIGPVLSGSFRLS